MPFLKPSQHWLDRWMFVPKPCFETDSLLYFCVSFVFALLLSSAVCQCQSLMLSTGTSWCIQLHLNAVLDFSQRLFKMGLFLFLPFFFLCWKTYWRSTSASCKHYIATFLFLHYSIFIDAKIMTGYKHNFFNDAPGWRIPCRIYNVSCLRIIFLLKYKLELWLKCAELNQEPFELKSNF